MLRPSGDQRGEVMPSEPGSGATLLLARSRTLTVLFGFPRPSGPVAKTIFCPSGDQVGSVSGSRSLGRRRRGTPPCEETIHIAAVPRNEDESTKRSWVPSGDQ